jgi:MoxR-like ATPase
VLSGRGYVAPDDVKAVTVGCLSHRIITDDDSDENYASAKRIVRGLLETTSTPRP